MSFRNKILARLSSLDMIISPPAAITRILPLLGEKGSGVRSELDSILKDAAIGERILQVANSPSQGYGGTVNNIDQALMILGENLVKCLVFSISVHDHVVARCPGKDKEHNRLWLHFLETASAARNLELILRFENAENAYVAGLLHDLGRVFLLAYFGGEAFQVSRLVAGGMTLIEAEREHLGVDHQEIGRIIARRWNLPEFLQETMADHHPRHAADLNELSPLSRIVSLSDNLSLASGEYPPGAGGAAARLGIIETCCRFMNLRIEDIKRVYATLPDDVSSSAGALDLNLGDSSRYLSEINSDLLQLIFELGSLIGKEQGMSLKARQRESIHHFIEPLRAALGTISDYITDAVTNMSGQFETLRLLHQDGQKDDVFERVPEISESLNESALRISEILQELSRVVSPEYLETLESPNALDTVTSLKDSLKEDPFRS